MRKSKFTEKEQALFHSLEAKKEPIQAKLNELNSQLRDVSKTLAEHKAIREQVKTLKPELVPMAEMQASLANPASRDKYFPDHTKQSLVTHVEQYLK